VVDYDFIEATIRADASKYKIVEVAFDPWNATSVSNHLIEEGLNMIEFRQGFVSMNPAMKALEVAIAEKTIAHGGQPVLTWMADNLVAKQDPAGNLKPDKEKSTEKIDGMVSLIMSYYRAILAAPKESVYEKRGIKML
jgi:phage terminase large subunit-like protein